MMKCIVKRPYLLAFLTIGKDLNWTSTYFSSDDPNSGWYRLKLMFKNDEYGQPTNEYTSSMNNVIGGFLVTSFIGGYLSMRRSQKYFEESNLSFKFYDHITAKRKLKKILFSKFIKESLIWGCKGALYTGIFTYTVTMVSLYRGKSSLLEYMCAGFLVGWISKIKYGIRGLIIGGSFGTFISILFGCLHLSLLSLSGIRMETIVDLHYSPPDDKALQRKMHIKKQIEFEESAYTSKANTRLNA